MESLKEAAVIDPNRRIALDKLANAVEKSNAKAIAKMFEGVSETERSRVRAALLEIHGIFGWNKEGIKRSAKNKYTLEECKKKCGVYFDCIVPIAVGGLRDQLDHAINLGLLKWPKETCKLLRDRHADWLMKYLKKNVNFDSHEQWMVFVSEGVYLPELDEVGVQTLIQSFYKDPTASKLKKVYQKFPWVSELVYQLYSFENLVVDTNSYVGMLPGLLAFIDYLSEKKILDRIKLVGAVLNGLNQVPKVKHASACLEILEYLDPSVAEFAASQNEICSALTNCVSQGQEYLLKQLERCCSTKGFDGISASLAIAAILPSSSIVSAKQACQTLMAFSQSPANRGAVISALCQVLLHAKREIAELGLKCLSTLCSFEDKDAIQAVNSVLPHCSQVIKKQVSGWLSGKVEIPKLQIASKTEKPKKSAPAIGSNAIAKNPKQTSEPLKRSRESIKAIRTAIPSVAASRVPESQMQMHQLYYKKTNRSLPGQGILFDHLVSLHFGMPSTSTALEILALIKKCELSSSGYNWWNEWLQSFTAAVVLGDKQYAQSLANWMTFERGESDYARLSPGIYFLTMLLANSFRQKKLALTRAMQMVLDKDKFAASWLDVYRALEASSESDFNENFEKAAQKHIELYESRMRISRTNYCQIEPISEIGSLLWHAAMQKGFDVYQLSSRSMAIVMTSHSLLDAGEPDPSDTLPSKVSDERLNQHIALVDKLFASCGIKYAITGPITEQSCNELKIIRRQIVTDASEETYQKLNQAHDPFQFSLSRLFLESVRRFEQPMLFDIKNVAGLSHVQLPKDALEKVLSMAKPTKQNGTVVPTICNEHTVALACPTLDYVDNRKRVVAKTRTKDFDWKVAEQLASQIPDALEKLKTIPKK